MFKRSLIAAGLLAGSISNVQALPYGYYDARSVGMGNVSVATGGIATAALSNPGMLSVNESDDSFALLIGIGAQAIDNGDVIDLADEFQALEADTQSTNPTVQAAAIQQQINILNELKGTGVVLGATPNIAFVSTGENFTWGITARANAVVSAIVTDVDTSIIDPKANIASLGVLTTELGIPLGTDVSFAGLQVSFGVIPKIVQVDAIDYKFDLVNDDIDNIADRDSEDLGNFTTLDAGITVNVIDTVRVGLVAKNLIEETKTTSLGTEINFDTHLRAGAAFDAGFMTLAADMDLTEIESVAGENPSQSLSVGLEFDTFDIVQIRAGYQTNMASGAKDPDLFSVGLGLWLGFHVDVALVAGEDSSFGAFAQTGFRF